MGTFVLSSTAFLTVLMAIGLVFFIRASAKDRTEIAKLVTERSQDSLLEQLRDYFAQRSYRVTAIDAERNQVTFEGFVRPSYFLAAFLSVLAAVGILCLSLVLSLLFPAAGNVFLGLVLLAPLAGVFYWQRAGRSEQVSLRVDTLNASSSATDSFMPHSLLTVQAHRDELAELQRALNLKLLESE